ncbi:MAG: DNA polymerase III subunit epsilon [Marinobacter sp. T13-3]|nr:MAG: DNA polymerase III subunit epsilon [Marinobacter sp. T13-3]
MTTNKPDTTKQTSEEARQAERNRIVRQNYEFLKEIYPANTLGLLCGLGYTQTRSTIDRKSRDPSMASYRGATLADTLQWQLLRIMHNDGYDLEGFEFDEHGELISTPKRPTRSNG